MRMVQAPAQREAVQGGGASITLRPYLMPCEQSIEGETKRREGFLPRFCCASGRSFPPLIFDFLLLQVF